MHISVRFWGITARIAGESWSLTLPPAATVADAAERLSHPAELAAELRRCAFAVGDALVPAHHPLADGDTLDVLPPVAGG